MVFSRIWLGIKSLAMTILFPGTVAGLLPYLILSPLEISSVYDWSIAQYVAIPIMGIGLAILLRSIWEFASTGKGTLAPFDEPRKLVVKGLYRYVRNPMYVGVILILLGESLFFWSGALFLYSGICFLGFNLFIIGFEEGNLRSKFGDEYKQYCEKVNRWIPGKPYS